MTGDEAKARLYAREHLMEYGREDLVYRAYLAGIHAGREQERDDIVKFVETIFTKIDGPGWLAQDQRISIAQHIATEIRKRW